MKKKREKKITNGQCKEMWKKKRLPTGQLCFPIKLKKKTRSPDPPKNEEYVFCGYLQGQREIQKWHADLSFGSGKGGGGVDPQKRVDF